jgi:20S proteasome alpha/beta subunit
MMSGCLIFLCLYCLLHIVLSGFSTDGSLQQIIFAQNAVDRASSGLDEPTLIAIKHGECTMLVHIQRNAALRSKLQIRSFDDQPTIHFKNERLIAYLVGNKVDCQQGRVLCNEFNIDSQLRIGTQISAPRLALTLADYAQESSMGTVASRQLAMNALIVNLDSESAGLSSQYGSIYKVDVSGNYFQCQSACVGADAKRVSAWLSTRGLFLAGALRKSRAETTDLPVPVPKLEQQGSAQTKEVNLWHPRKISSLVSENVSALFLQDDTFAQPFSQSLCDVLNITLCCLRENFPDVCSDHHEPALGTDNCSFSVHFTVLQSAQSSKDAFTRYSFICCFFCLLVLLQFLNNNCYVCCIFTRFICGVSSLRYFLLLFCCDN